MTVFETTATSDELPCATHSDAAGRRAVLGGLAVAVGALCAGCASSKSSSAAAGAPTSSAGAPTSSGGSVAATAPSSGSDTTSAASSAGSSGASGSGGGAAALAPTSAVPVGGGKVLSDQAIVLTQPTAGTFKAFTAICTHAGCTVGSVEGGLIVCPCHGSRYHIADGSVAGGPAPAPLAPIAIKVSGGEITKA